MAKKVSIKKTSREFTFTVFYQPIKAGGYQVTVPLLTGLVTYGRTFEEAREMARDAILCHVEGMRTSKTAVPSEISILQERVMVMA